MNWSLKEFKIFLCICIKLISNFMYCIMDSTTPSAYTSLSCYHYMDTSLTMRRPIQFSFVHQINNYEQPSWSPHEHVNSKSDKLTIPYRNRIKFDLIIVMLLQRETNHYWWFNLPPYRYILFNFIRKGRENIEIDILYVSQLILKHMIYIINELIYHYALLTW